MEPPDLHLNALFAELHAKLGPAAAAQAARDTANAHRADRKDFPELSRVDAGAVNRQIVDVSQQLSEQVTTSWDLAQTQASAQQIAHAGESELHRSAKTCSEIVDRVRAQLGACQPEHAIEGEAADAVGRAVDDLVRMMRLPSLDALLAPDEAFRRTVDADRRKLLDRIAASERADNDVVDALEAELLRVERGELALYVSEVRLLQGTRDADGLLHEHSARLRAVAVAATGREQAWRAALDRLGAVQAELQIGTETVSDGSAREGDAHTTKIGALGHEERATAHEIEDTEREMRQLAKRLVSLHERRFRAAKEAEAEHMREVVRREMRAAELATLHQLSDRVAALKADAERRAGSMVSALDCVATATRAVLYGYEQRASDSRAREAQLHQQLLDRFGEVYSKLQRDAKNIRARLVDSDWRLDTLKQQQGQMATTKDARRVRAVDAEIENEARMRSIDEATLVKLKYEMDRLWPYAAASEAELARLGRAPVRTLEALETVVQAQIVEHEEARLGVMMQLASDSLDAARLSHLQLQLDAVRAIAEGREDIASVVASLSSPLSADHSDGQLGLAPPSFASPSRSRASITFDSPTGAKLLASPNAHLSQATVQDVQVKARLKALRAAAFVIALYRPAVGGPEGAAAGGLPDLAPAPPPHSPPHALAAAATAPPAAAAPQAAAAAATLRVTSPMRSRSLMRSGPGTLEAEVQSIERRRAASIKPVRPGAEATVPAAAAAAPLSHEAAAQAPAPGLPSAPSPAPAFEAAVPPSVPVASVPAPAAALAPAAAPAPAPAPPATRITGAAPAPASAPPVELPPAAPAPVPAPVPSPAPAPAPAPAAPSQSPFVLATVSDLHDCVARINVPRTSTAAAVIDAMCAEPNVARLLHLEEPPYGVAAASPRSGVRLRAYLPGPAGTEFVVLANGTRLCDGAVGSDESGVALWLEQRSEDGSWPWGDVPLEFPPGYSAPEPADDDEELSSSAWAALLKPGAFVDAKDETGKWCKAVIKAVDPSPVGPLDDVLDVHFLGWTDAWNEELLRSEAPGQLAPFMSLSLPWELALRPGDLVELNRAHDAIVAALAAAAADHHEPAIATAASNAAQGASRFDHGAAAASRGLWVVACVVSMDHAHLPPLMTVAFAVPAEPPPSSAGGSAAAALPQLGAVPALATLPVLSADKDACVRLGTHITRDRAAHMFKPELFARAGIVLPAAPAVPSYADAAEAEEEAGGAAAVGAGDAVE